MKQGMWWKRLLMVIGLVLLGCTIYLKYQEVKLRSQLVLVDARFQAMYRTSIELRAIARTLKIRYSWLTQYECEDFAYWYHKYSRMSGCDWYLFAAMHRREATFNPVAKNKGSSAYGYSQLIDDTFNKQKQRLGFTNKKRPWREIQILNFIMGIDLMTQGKRKGEYNVQKMLSLYNCGHTVSNSDETDEYVVQVPEEMERLKFIYEGVLEHEYKDTVQTHLQ